LSSIKKGLTVLVLLITCLSGWCGHNDSFSKASGFVVPIAYYTTETSLALGLGGIAYYNFGDNRTETRPSSAYFFATYTLNRQWIIDLPYHIFSNREEWYITGEFAKYDFPFKFYGVGCEIDPGLYERYHLKQTKLYATAYKKFMGNWYVGPRLWTDHFHDIHYQPNGELSMLNLGGKNGGKSTGLGASLLYDNRRNVYCPQKGWYVELSYLNYAINSLNTNSFHNIRFDIRNYTKLGKGTVLASNFYGNFNLGRVPFYMLAEFGGLFRMRGYYRGSYRDKNAVLFQTELRQKIKGRLGGAVFGGVASVFGNSNNKDGQLLKPSVGAGLRFVINRKENIPLRADYGMGQGFSGTYITTGEAF